MAPLAQWKDWLIVHYWWWKENRSNNPRLRMIFILPPIIIALGLAIPPLFLGMYNYPGRFICVICDYPYGCTSSDEVDCERGEGGVTYSDYSHGYCVLRCDYDNVCMLAGLRNLSAGEKDRQIFDKWPRTEKGQHQQDRVAGNPVCRSVFLFILSFFRSSQLQSLGQFGHPWCLRLHLFVILLPLLGFFNALVYFRPRYVAYKKRNPE